MSIDKEELWHANRALNQDLAEFCDVINNYEDNKLTNLLLKHFFNNKHLSEFNPTTRSYVLSFFKQNYIPIKKIIEEYND